MPKKPEKSFFKSRGGYILVALVTAGAAYAAFSRAIDTGSIIQYTAGFILIGVGINRLIRSFRNT